MKEQIFATDKFNSQNPITRKSSLLHNMRLCSFIWSPYNLHNLNFQYNNTKDSKHDTTNRFVFNGRIF